MLHRCTLPIATVDLDELTLVDTNGAVRAAIGLGADDALPQKLGDLVVSDDRDDSGEALDLLARRALIAYESRRLLKCVDGTTFDARIWVRSLHNLDIHAALIVFVRYGTDGSDDFGGQLPAARLRLSGPVVVGSIDLEMRVVRCSEDVHQLLGDSAEALIGRSLVERIHPDDVATFLLGLGRAVAEDQGTGMHVRVRSVSGDYVGVRLVVTPTHGSPDKRLGIVMTSETKVESGDARVGELERHLWRIALEVQAAGVVDGLQRLPDASQLPGLDDLSPRQWDIATRLLRGERVPDIARATFVSQSTVRNQLASIYRKLGVHSQAELLALLRGEGGQTV